MWTTKRRELNKDWFDGYLAAPEDGLEVILDLFDSIGTISGYYYKGKWYTSHHEEIEDVKIRWKYKDYVFASKLIQQIINES